MKSWYGVSNVKPNVPEVQTEPIKEQVENIEDVETKEEEKPKPKSNPKSKKNKGIE